MKSWKIKIIGYIKPIETEVKETFVVEEINEFLARAKAIKLFRIKYAITEVAISDVVEE